MSVKTASTVGVRAGREVVLSAGAVNSPQILMLSGIGDADELIAHGIDVVHHLPGVGKNLQDHVDVCLVYEVTEPVTLYSDLRVDRLTRAIVAGRGLRRGRRHHLPLRGRRLPEVAPGTRRARHPGALHAGAGEDRQPPLAEALRSRARSRRTTASPSASVRSTRRAAGAITLRSADPRRPAEDLRQLPRHRIRQGDHHRRGQADARGDGAAGRSTTSAAASSRRARTSRPTPALTDVAEAGRRNHAPPGRHLQDGARTRSRWSMPSSGSTASPASASPMPRSCRSSRAATPTPRPS